MTMPDHIPDPWRGRQFGTGYSAEYRPAGEATWRIVRRDGEVAVYPTRAEAVEAAKQAFLARYETPIRATIQRSEEEETQRMAEKLAGEADAFLRSSRQDVKAAQTHHRAGKRAFVEMRGRA
jgi:hypothetical protein